MPVLAKVTGSCANCHTKHNSLLFLMGCDIIWDIEEVGPPVYPNYYDCNCECSQSVTAVGQNCGVFPLPKQENRIGTEPNGGMGTIIDGPVIANFNANPETWWKVHFDDTSLEGWAVQKFLSLVSENSMTKDAKVCLPEHINQNRGAAAGDPRPYGLMQRRFSCTKPKSCRVGIEGATITIFDSGVIDDTISWIVSAIDATGNESQQTCELSVIKKK